MASMCKLNSGYEMPQHGLGTWLSKPGEVEEAVKIALREGYRHLDTAHIYGNEGEVGAGLEKSIKEGVVKREEVFVTTKLWCTMHHKEDVRAALKTSMKKLRLDYLDLFLIHWPICLQRGEDNQPTDEKGFLLFDDVALLETWQVLEECVKEGLIRSIGLSNCNSLQVKDLLTKCHTPPAVLQVEVHPYFQQHQLHAFCREHNILMTGYSCLGAPQRPWATEEDKKVLEDEVLKRIASKHHKSAAHVAIRWMLQRGIVAIPKSVNASRIKQNIQVFDFELSASEMEEIKGVDQGMRVLLPVKTIDGKVVEIFKEAPHYPFSAEF